MANREFQPKHKAPEGYVPVKSGAIRADDLVLDWPNKVWRRHDSPDWDSRVELAEDAVMVARKPRLDGSQFSSSRNYAVKRIEPVDTATAAAAAAVAPATAVMIDDGSQPTGQGSLFND